MIDKPTKNLNFLKLTYNPGFCIDICHSKKRLYSLNFIMSFVLKNREKERTVDFFTPKGAKDHICMMSLFIFKGILPTYIKHTIIDDIVARKQKFVVLCVRFYIVIKNHSGTHSTQVYYPIRNTLLNSYYAIHTYIYLHNIFH